VLKKLFILFFISLSVVMAQTEDDNYQPVERKPTFDSPFGAGGGYFGGVVMNDLSKLNSSLMGFGTQDLSQTSYLSGGGGFAYVMFIKYLRVGGVGLSSGTTSKATVNGFDKEARYSNAFGGLTIEYSLPFIRNWALSIGGIIGVGGQDLELYKQKGSVDWTGDLGDFKNDNATISSFGRKYSNTYMLLAPTINADILLHPMVSLRIGAGYSFTLFGDTWKAGNGATVNNFPANDVKGNAFFFQVGILAGVFFY
jgi:hypothetical protein